MDQSSYIIISTPCFVQWNDSSTSSIPHPMDYIHVAIKSNSVYVSVLKIPIVHTHTDGVSKLLSQKIFFARTAIFCEGQNIIFRDDNGNKQRLGPPVPKRRQFSNIFSQARVLKWGRKREKQWKRRLGIRAVTICFTVRGWNATNFDRKTLW